MQTIKEFIHHFFKNNLTFLEKNYPGLREKRILDDYCQYHNLAPDQEYEINENDKFIKLIQLGTPLEYILKESFFYKNEFIVDSRVLIPRSETEILVEDSINFIREKYHPGFRILEVGVGSFCMGLTIAMEVAKPLSLVGGDISIDALDVAKENLAKHQAMIPKGTQIDLVQSDRLSSIESKFDFIISNPPYIKVQKDRDGVHFQAHNFEPHTALYLEDQIYTEWFRDFFSESFEKLNESGAFFMEGHEDHLEELKAIAEKIFKKVEIKKDYTHRERFLYAYK